MPAVPKVRGKFAETLHPSRFGVYCSLAWARKRAKHPQGPMGAENAHSAKQGIFFSPFHLDLRAGRLTRGGAAIALRPKTWAVLVHLAERPGALVSRDELLDAVWPGVAVTPDTLTKSIGELRVALGDTAKVPRFIETVHRRGFRFIATTGEEPLVDPAAPRAATERTAFRPFVGRDAELRRLEDRLAMARAGKRRIVFLTGPAGIGKSALLEAFLESPSRHESDLWVGRGTCVEQHGSREAYLPAFEAIERLARRPDGGRLVKLLERKAPTWLAQMPWLIDDGAKGAALARSQQAARAERMLREVAVLIEALTSDLTLVLVLEDLHWSDPSTVDLLAFLAQRREPARLLVIATYRPADAAVREHVLPRVVRAMELRRQCEEIPLHDLERDAVRRYVEARFPGAPFAASLAEAVHRHTDGHPLFTVAAVEHLVSRGLVLETAPGWALAVPAEKLTIEIPDDVRRMIETQIEGLLPAERDLLEAASAAGLELAPQAVAAALGCETTEAETRCEALARTHRFLRTAGRTEWPDGSHARRYAFGHELYRQALYEGVPDARRQRLHQRIGEALEAAAGARAAEHAPELAAHFEKSRDLRRAVRYLAAAAARARQRFVNREVLGYIEPALALAERLPDEHDRARREIELRMILGPVLNDLEGYASEALRRNYERADLLAGEFATPAEQFEIVYALCYFRAVRGDAEADATATRLADLAERVGGAEARLRADTVRLEIDVVSGRFDAARKRMEERVEPNAASGVDPRCDFGSTPLIDAQGHYALALWFLGHREGANSKMRANLAAARLSGSLVTLAGALCLGGILEIFCGNPAEALALSEEVARLADEHGFRFWGALAAAVKGRATVLGGDARTGLAEIQRARGLHSGTGARIFSSHILAFLADAYRRLGAFDESLAAVDEGLAVAESTLDRTFLPELWRLKGELLLAGLESAGSRRSRKQDSRRTEAEGCLGRALELARRSEAKSLELRAANSLARALRQRGEHAEAHALLAPVCRWFGKVSVFNDLAEARALLAEGGRAPRRPVA